MPSDSVFFEKEGYFDAGYKVYIGPGKYFVTSDVGSGASSGTHFGVTGGYQGKEVIYSSSKMSLKVGARRSTHAWIIPQIKS